ncbi:MAG TPA: DNA translocase FtsK 4TM domain-containing protein, partial [bacterium]|nr:DNA translocase FtsK 4TM domain-containing protein [bacterium]
MGRRRHSSPRRQGVGALLVVAALLLGLSFLPEARGLPVLLGRAQRVALGDIALLIPLTLFLVGAVLAIAGEQARFSRRVGAIVLGILTGIAIYHSQVPRGDEFAEGLAGEQGGVVGAALVWSIREVFGQVGAWLIIGLAAVATLTLWSGTTSAALMQAIWMGVTVVARVAVAAVAGAVGWIGDTSRAAVLTARTVFARLGGRVVDALPPPALEPEPAATLIDADSMPAPATAGVEPNGAEIPARDVTIRQPGGRQFQQGSLALEVPTGGFQLPPVSLLADLPSMRNKGKADPAEVGRLLEQTLGSFGVEARVVRWEQGPVVTRFEVQPAPGVRVQKISSLTNDIALALAAASVRIEAPIPGKSAVGIELPNQKTALVHIKEILESEEYRRQIPPLTVALGKDIAGHPILGDLAEMPHVLIAGATGSGKSVMLNAIIAGLLFRCTPLDVRLLMIDPKRVEFTNYNNIPHLLAPVVTNPRAAAGALKEMLREMEERFERFAASGVRNIQTYNQIPDGERLPFIVIIIDELADLMMIAPADFEDVICRLAQMTRATGIHMVLATQRPSVDVITGLIKANIPSRIAFAVSSQVDSRTILDMPGAEKLLGKGDMLYMPVGLARPVRAQGAFIADSEIQALVTWWKSQGKPVFDQEVVAAGKPASEGEGDEDELLAEAGRLIVRAG